MTQSWRYVRIGDKPTGTHDSGKVDASISALASSLDRELAPVLPLNQP
jgi:hypothetical protein